MVTFPTWALGFITGLSSLNDNLPQYISMGTREYWNKRDGHYLGPAHDAVPLRVDPANPLDFGSPQRPMSVQTQSIGAELIKNLNDLRQTAYPQDAGLAARTAAYELAFRMQRSVPALLDFSQETAETRAFVRSGSTTLS